MKGPLLLLAAAVAGVFFGLPWLRDQMSATVRVGFTTEPYGALVEVDGHREIAIGGESWAYLGREGTYTVRVSAAGYRPNVFQVVRPTASQTIHVKLDPDVDPNPPKEIRRAAFDPAG